MGRGGGEPDAGSRRPRPGEAPKLVERERPSPGPEEVRIAVDACGVCGGDTAGTEGGAAAYPRVPGHEIAGRMGADKLVDISEEDPADVLKSMGGADAVLATPPSAAAVKSVVGGHAREGEVIVVGAPAEPARLDLARMLDGRWSVVGWSCGHARDEQYALEVAARAGIKPRVQRYPLEEAGDALAALTDGSARFHGVLEL